MVYTSKPYSYMINSKSKAQPRVHQVDAQLVDSPVGCKKNMRPACPSPILLLFGFSSPSTLACLVLQTNSSHEARLPPHCGISHLWVSNLCFPPHLIPSCLWVLGYLAPCGLEPFPSKCALRRLHFSIRFLIYNKSSGLGNSVFFF